MNLPYLYLGEGVARLLLQLPFLRLGPRGSHHCPVNVGPHPCFFVVLAATLLEKETGQLLNLELKFITNKYSRQKLTIYFCSNIFFKS